MSVMVLSVGLFSCEAETSVEETEALYQLQDVEATDDDQNDSEVRDDN
ncbi:MAG: hypothetical protein AB3N16_03735 [Flavobacteriaceae bacterium]